MGPVLSSNIIYSSNLSRPQVTSLQVLRISHTTSSAAKFSQRLSRAVKHSAQHTAYSRDEEDGGLQQQIYQELASPAGSGGHAAYNSNEQGGSQHQDVSSPLDHLAFVVSAQDAADSSHQQDRNPQQPADGRADQHPTAAEPDLAPDWASAAGLTREAELQRLQSSASQLNARLLSPQASSQDSPALQSPGGLPDSIGMPSHSSVEVGQAQQPDAVAASRPWPKQAPDPLVLTEGVLLAGSLQSPTARRSWRARHAATLIGQESLASASGNCPSLQSDGSSAWVQSPAGSGQPVGLSSSSRLDLAWQQAPQLTTASSHTPASSAAFGRPSPATRSAAASTKASSNWTVRPVSSARGGRQVMDDDAASVAEAERLAARISHSSRGWTESLQGDDSSSSDSDQLPPMPWQRSPGHMQMPTQQLPMQRQHSLQHSAQKAHYPTPMRQDSQGDKAVQAPCFEHLTCMREKGLLRCMHCSIPAACAVPREIDVQRKLLPTQHGRAGEQWRPQRLQPYL